MIVIMICFNSNEVIVFILIQDTQAIDWPRITNDIECAIKQSTTKTQVIVIEGILILKNKLANHN